MLQNCFKYQLQTVPQIAFWKFFDAFVKNMFSPITFWVESISTVFCQCIISSLPSPQIADWQKIFTWSQYDSAHRDLSFFSRKLETPVSSQLSFSPSAFLLQFLFFLQGQLLYDTKVQSRQLKWTPESLAHSSLEMSYIFDNKSLKMALPGGILNKENLKQSLVLQNRPERFLTSHHLCCPKAGSTTWQLCKFIKT